MLFVIITPHKASGKTGGKPVQIKAIMPFNFKLKIFSHTYIGNLITTVSDIKNNKGCDTFYNLTKLNSREVAL